MGLAVAGAAALVLGCEHHQSSHYPPDPLLLSKKPVTSRPQPGPLTAVAGHEPPAPASLLTSRASTDREGSSATSPASLPHDTENQN